MQQTFLTVAPNNFLKESGETDVSRLLGIFQKEGASSLPSI